MTIEDCCRGGACVYLQGMDEVADLRMLLSMTRFWNGQIREGIVLNNKYHKHSGRYRNTDILRYLIMYIQWKW